MLIAEDDALVRHRNIALADTHSHACTLFAFMLGWRSGGSAAGRTYQQAWSGLQLRSAALAAAAATAAHPQTFLCIITSSPPTGVSNCRVQPVSSCERAASGRSKLRPWRTAANTRGAPKGCRPLEGVRRWTRSIAEKGECAPSWPIVAHLRLDVKSGPWKQLQSACISLLYRHGHASGRTACNLCRIYSVTSFLRLKESQR